MFPGAQIADPSLAMFSSAAQLEIPFFALRCEGKKTHNELRETLVIMATFGFNGLADDFKTSTGRTIRTSS